MFIFTEREKYTLEERPQDFCFTSLDWVMSTAEPCRIPTSTQSSQSIKPRQGVDLRSLQKHLHG